jgi:hypothetical protein
LAAIQERVPWTHYLTGKSKCVNGFKKEASRNPATAGIGSVSGAEDGPAEERRERTTVLGKRSKMTKSEAREKIAEILEPINSRAAQAANVYLTVTEFVATIYFPIFKPKWKRSTMATNVDRINHHIVEKFGNRQMRTLDRKELQGFLDSKAHLSFSTVDHLRWDLKQMLHVAWRRASS